MAQLAQADFRNAEQLGQARIGEPFALEAEQRIAINIRLAGGFEGSLFFDQVFDLYQIPWIYMRVVEHFFHGHPGSEGIADVPKALGSRHIQFLGEGFLAVGGA